jgi:hypothetical protein
MSGWPDPRRAQALVIGTEQYDDERYPALPPAAASASQVARLIAAGDIWGGLPDENIQRLIGRVTVRDAARAIQAKASEPDLSALLIYICGHGQRWTEDHVPDKDLHFAFSDSDRSWPFTHLPFLAVRAMLTGGTQAAATLLIIDCCYASGAFLAGDEPARPLDVQGICTMVATRWPVRAPASWPGTQYTAFSGALIEVVEQGIPGPEQYLTPGSVFRSLRRRLAGHGMPEPDTRGNGGQVFLCRNNGYQLARDPSSSYAELLAGLDTASDIDLAAYASAVREGHAAGQPDVAASLVAEFAARRPAADTVRLAAVLRAADLGAYAERGIGQVCRRRPGTEIGELVHLLHRHADLDLDRVLATLAQRPAGVVAALRAALDGRDCDDCRAVNHQIGEQILGAWPPSRLDELLGALPGREGGPARDSRA